MTGEVKGLSNLLRHYDSQVREQLAKQLEEGIRPLLYKRTSLGGYNCCGCGSYDEILDHAIRIVKGEQS